MKRIISSILVLAMLLTIVPVAFAETPYQVSFDSTEYNVAPGGTVEVPVYLSAPDGSEVKLTLTQVNVGIPTGFSATVTGDAISDAKINGSDVVFFKDSTDTPYSKRQALGKITFTAPSVEGTYDLVFTKIELFDADYLQYDNSMVAMVAAKIIVKDSSTTPTLEKITANPTALTVPYENQSDIEGYVKGNVVVTATYSDASTKAVTDYAVNVEGTTATITYEGKTATVALTLAPKPEEPSKYNYVVQLDKTSYEVEAGGTFEVPVYLSAPDGGEVKVTLTQINVGIPDGFSATVAAGTISDAKINGSDVVFFKDSTDEVYSKANAIGTITFTAPSKAGDYELKFTKVELFDADYLQYDASVINAIGAKVVVKGGGTVTPTLEKITVNPTALTVPYENQSDIEGYVKGNVVVTATYSDKSTKTVTDYEVSVDGTTATITYEGKTATVALTLAPNPEEPSKYNYVVQLDKTSYEVEAGGTFEVPVYLSAPDGGEVKVTLTQINVGIPDGFSATVAAGTISDAKINGSDVVFFKDSTDEVYSKANAIGTITFTAPSKAGDYELKFTKVELFDADYLQYDADIINAIGATITVTGGSTPAKVLEDIEISYTDPIEIPYGADEEETIRKAITVKAIYSNGDTDDNVTNYDVAIAENVATISYTVDGTTKSKTINLKYQAKPVLTVEKLEITVPYGTENVEAYVKEQIDSGYVKLDDDVLALDEYKVEFTNGDVTATVKYAKDENITATVNVTYVTLTGVVAELNEGLDKIELPWSIPDGAEAEVIKTYIVVKGQLSDGNTTAALENADYDVVYDAEKGEFYVTYGGFQSNVLKATKASEPAAEVTGITVNKESVNVPYGKTDEQIIDIVKGGVVVTATYDKGEPSAVAAADYEVTIEDDKATITYKGFTAVVTLVKETRKLELSKTEITVDDGTDKDGIIAYVKANVTAKYVYSQTTGEQTIPAEDLTITVNDELTEVTVEIDGEKATIAVKIAVTPDFTENVKVGSNAYGIADAKLVIFTDVKEGKVIKVTDENGEYVATYMGNGKWAAVTKGAYKAEAVEGTPEAANFGRLHDDSMVTAYDALITLLKANNNEVKIFDNDYQKYLLADVDGDGQLTAEEALYINRISLGTADEANLWFNK